MVDNNGIDLTEPTPVLFKKVVDWGKDKGIVGGPGADPTKQLAKTLEELGEVASALLRNNREGFEDGIGDVMVCLIILAAQQGSDAFKCLQGAYDEIKGRKGKTVDGVFVKEQDLQEEVKSCGICGRKKIEMEYDGGLASVCDFCQDCGRCLDSLDQAVIFTTNEDPSST